MRDDHAFEKLKTLLLSEDWQLVQEMREEIRALTREIHDKDQLIETLDPVIADLLERKIHESKPEMAEALAPVMGDAIKKQIEEAKEDMVDALYPIVGSMVAKAINEAMRKMMEEINARMQQAANTRFITFVKARILHIQPAEMLISEGIRFALDELFLIEKQSGLLVAYQSRHETHSESDAHILGSMLSAVRQFMKDTFTTNQPSELIEIQHEGRQLS